MLTHKPRVLACRTPKYSSYKDSHLCLYELISRVCFPQKLSLLRQPSGYQILSSCSDVATIDDMADFKDLSEAFIALKFSPEEVQGL